MKRSFMFLITSLLIINIVSVSNLAMAAKPSPPPNTTFTQNVTIQVAVINEISVSGNPSALIITLATAGSQPVDVKNSATSYNISSNASNAKITGVLGSAMPAGASLKINLAPPTGATSMGDVTLSTVASDLVTGISKIAESGKTITYTFSATVAAGVVTAGSRKITLTITN